MKDELNKKPDTYAFHNLQVKFANGAPLSCAELNFLSGHEKALGHLSELMRYYMKPHYQKAADDHSFLLHTKTLDKEAIAQLKRRLGMLLRSQPSLQLSLTPEQFAQLRAVTTGELILYHGNQFLTGAPFFPGGIVPVLFFQWGNAFGVAKYAVLVDEKALLSNVLVYFEDMGERNLDECVHEYVHTHEIELKSEMQHALDYTMHIPSEELHHTAPRLTLGMYHPEKETE